MDMLKEYVKKWGIENNKLKILTALTIIRIIPPLTITHDGINLCVNIMEKIISRL